MRKLLTSGFTWLKQADIGRDPAENGGKKEDDNGKEKKGQAENGERGMVQAAKII